VTVPRRLLIAILCASLAGCRPDEVPAQVTEPTLYDVTGVFQLPRLTESSGVAVSRSLDGVLWTHNDSGDEPWLYATDLSGAARGVFRVGGARAVDWEDIALGPCPGETRPCLYIADTGDNLESRPSVDLYIVPEPASLPLRTDSLVTLTARRLRVRYADGPHDVEALAVSPDGEVMLISKGRTGSIGLYRLRAIPADSATVLLQRSEQLAIVPQRSFGRLVTGAAISPSGRALVVRTYVDLVFYRLENGELSDQAVCWLGMRDLQGEGVDFLDDSTLVLTSESVAGRPGTIARVRCPIVRPRP
jgi:hypothetical protein